MGMSYFKIKNNKLNYIIPNFVLFSGTTVLITIFLISLYGIGTNLHHDEWMGRGLYPGLALAKGFDLYEPLNGPHVTLYGWANALFYSPCILGDTPVKTIWIGFILNLLSFSIPIFYILKKSLDAISSGIELKFFLYISTIILIFAICGIEPTTESIFRIHADMPAFFYLLLSVCFFLIFLDEKKYYFLFLNSFFIILAFWTKVTTLPAILYPFLILMFYKSFRESFFYLTFTLLSFFLTLTLSSLYFGYNDMVTILFDHIAPSLWSDRAHLFDGSNAILVSMSYIEAIPLLFRFGVMYVAEYWYLIVPILFIFLTVIKNRSSKDKIFLILITIYFLLLPPCLAALAHLGGVENSLFFANATAVVTIVLYCSVNSYKIISSNSIRTLFFLTISTIVLLPILRTSQGCKKDPYKGPQHLAYEYLVAGNDDVYFGWYPISHLLHSGSNLTCIEVPIWGAYSLLDIIDFSSSHFPVSAKYLATGPGAIGSPFLELYLGELEEVTSPKELSGWRLFQIKN
jgi:hypothetical protein